MKIRNDTKQKIINDGKYPDISIGDYHYYIELINNGDNLVLMRQSNHSKQTPEIIAKYDNNNCLVWEI